MLVTGHARVTGDVRELHRRAHGEQALDRSDELLIGLRFPAFREHADRILTVGVDQHRALGVGHELERTEDRRELGDVVGSGAEELRQLGLLAAVVEHDAEPARTRVTRARAVRVDDHRIVRHHRSRHLRRALLDRLRLRARVVGKRRRIGHDEVRYARAIQLSVSGLVSHLHRTTIDDEGAIRVGSGENKAVTKARTNPRHATRA